MSEADKLCVRVAIRALTRGSNRAGVHDLPLRSSKRQAHSAAFAGAAICLLAGCSSDGGGLQGAPLSLPSSEAVAAITPKLAAQPVGSATDVYARIASGANACWFGPGGPLKKDYISHAEADAPSRGGGGKAEIVVHDRDQSQPNPRGRKAYKVKIEPTGDTSASVTTENLHMSEAFAAAMSDDVGRWSKGESGCAGSSAVTGWGVTREPEPSPPADVKKKSKSKVANAKAGSSSDRRATADR